MRSASSLTNLIWETGKLPNSFQQSTVIPILKPDKDAEDAASYRPIALTSSLSKLIECLIVNQLTHCLERDGVLSAVQSAFQSNRSTMDPLM